MSEGIKDKKEEIIDALGLPKESLFNLPKITIIGDIEILIENHKGLLKFNNNEILINSKLGIITIKGSNLNILYISDDTIGVKGEFEAVYYKERGRNAGE